MRSITHIYYIFSGRFPSEKAHALYAAKVCESFAEQGFTVTLVVPRRFGRSTKPYTEFFQMPHTFEVQYIPTIDLYAVPGLRTVAFYLHYFLFSVWASVFCFFKSNDKTYFVSNEGTVSFLCSFVSPHVLYEMHDYPHSGRLFFRWLFSRVGHVLTQNTIKRDLLVSDFGVPAEKIIVEPNAITLGVSVPPKESAALRDRLSLKPETFIVMYAGQLLPWKGVYTLGDALTKLPSEVCGVFLGGSTAQVQEFRERYAAYPNIVVLGHQPFSTIPQWQSIADCLVLPNTAREKISSLYTSPMKLFEYMASKRPIIASDLPSIRAIVDDSEVWLVTPDDSDALARQILFLKNHPELTKEKVARAYAQVSENTWEKRAVRLCTKLAIAAS